MGEIGIVRRCSICGAILQTERKEEPGYIDPEILKGKPLDALVSCESCYLENMQALSPRGSRVSEDFLTILEDARATEALIVYLVDLFSFECFFSPEVNERIKSLPILVLGNKRDLLPRKIKDEDLRKYVAHRFRVGGLPVKEEDVRLLSLSEGARIEEIRDEIERKRAAHDVYIIGAPLSGKSLFFNAFLRTYRNRSGRNIETRRYKGTDLRLMAIPLDSSSYLYDTPGEGGDNALPLRLPEVGRWTYYPAGETKARSFALEKGESLLLGGGVRLDRLEGEGKAQLRCYFAPRVEIQKAKGKKAEERYLTRSAPHPQMKEGTTLKDIDVFDIKVEEEGPRDIMVAGFGWIEAIGKGSLFRIYVPRGVGVSYGRAKVGK